MPKQEFEATEGLLHDVMRKQAGSIEKAVLEAVMNSVDAGASIIDIDLTEDELIVSDDGEGMTREEVNTYFKKFGLKDSDTEDKEFGKFRMGRGQIFNFGLNIWRSQDNIMVVNLENDVSEVRVGDEEKEVDTEGLSYNLLDGYETVEGCTVEVKLYNTLDDVGEKIKAIEELIEHIPFLFDVEIGINNRKIHSNFEATEELEYGYYELDDNSWKSGANVYNQGAKIGNFGDWPILVTAISKDDLDVNFARNDILDSCEVWQEMQEEITNVVYRFLISKQDLKNREVRWLLNKSQDDPNIREYVMGASIIPDVTGGTWTLNQLMGESITFAKNSSQAAKKAHVETNHVVLDNSLENTLLNFFEDENVISFDDAWKSEMKWEMTHIEEDKISKKRRTRLAYARWFVDEIGCRNNVEAGMSQMESVWKDEDDTIYIDKEFLNTSKDEFFFEGLVEVARVAAHRGSTRQEFSSDYAFKDDLAKYTQGLGAAMRKAYTGAVDVEDY